MKIRIAQIPTDEDITLTEHVSAGELDLDTDTIKFREPINIEADVSRILNVVTVDLFLTAVMYMSCSRCLTEFRAEIDRKMKLNYPVDKLQDAIDLDPDIREEIILNYPIQPLCREDCKGLCPKCGKNLNEGGCSCATT